MKNTTYTAGVYEHCISLSHLSTLTSSKKPNALGLLKASGQAHERLRLVSLLVLCAVQRLEITMCVSFAWVEGRKFYARSESAGADIPPLEKTLANGQTAAVTGVGQRPASIGVEHFSGYMVPTYGPPRLSNYPIIASSNSHRLVPYAGVLLVVCLGGYGI